jgi:outer membrane protein
MLKSLSFRLLACAFMSVLLLPVQAQQQTLPKWEIGLKHTILNCQKYIYELNSQ